MILFLLQLQWQNSIFFKISRIFFIYLRMNGSQRRCGITVPPFAQKAYSGKQQIGTETISYLILLENFGAVTKALVAATFFLPQHRQHRLLANYEKRKTKNKPCLRTTWKDFVCLPFALTQTPFTIYTKKLFFGVKLRAILCNLYSSSIYYFETNSKAVDLHFPGTLFKDADSKM